MTLVDLYEVMAASRNEIRSKVVNEFLKETAGTSAETSKYEYNVESYGTYKIVLKRPGLLKKGFDFSVNTRGIFYKKKKRYESPTFDDVINALNQVMSTYPSQYYKVKNVINNIFNVDDYDIHQLDGLYFLDYQGQKHPIAIIVLAIKWLFIAEDISYWNWSGRNKFMDYLKSNNLA